MRLGDLFDQSRHGLLAHRLRATLASIGIVCGVATVMTAFAIGEGARHAAIEAIGTLGIDNVFIRTVRPDGGPRTSRRPAAPILTVADARVIADSSPAIVTGGALRSISGEIRAGARRASARIAGTTVSWREIVEARVMIGRWLVDRDLRSRRRVVVLASGLAGALFPAGDGLAQRVLIAGEWHRVVGILADPERPASRRPAPERADLSGMAFVPLTALDAKLGDGDSLDRVEEIALRAREAGSVDTAAEVAVVILRRRHPHAAAAYEVVVPRHLLRARLRAQRTFNAVLLAIGALALLISGVGIMNIMLASVAERTGEIGVRRALGARRGDITAQFALEAGLLCVAGGIGGVLLGLIFALLVAVTAGWPVVVSARAVALAVALAGAVGLGFGIYPAVVAARLAPAAVLRA